MFAYLGVTAYGNLTFLTGIGEKVLVALDTVRVLISQNVTMPREGHVTIEAAEVPTVPVLIHGFGVFSRKNKLEQTKNSVDKTKKNYVYSLKSINPYRKCNSSANSD